MSMSTFNPKIAIKRRQRDIMKLLMSNYKVNQSKDNPGDFVIEFPGPKNTYYEDGMWEIHVLLPQYYPYKSPSIGFNNKIFHPNVDETSGSVCLDVINQAWSPMYDLVNVFEQFLPQLLSYPNPTDPLNTEAAQIMLNDPKLYEKKVKDYVQKHAQTLKKKHKQSQDLEEKPLRKQSSSLSIQLTNMKKKSESTTDYNSVQDTQASSDQELQEESKIEKIETKGGSQSNLEIEDNELNFTKKAKSEDNNEIGDNYSDQEEQEVVSNISMDNVSELSDLSDIQKSCY